jgi:hypothetical protein
VRLGRILACVVLVSVVVISSCVQEEDPYVTMYDPLNVLTEKIQLTDEQVETIETGTGTLQLTAEQVNMISDPVEQLLNELKQLLDETRWEEVEDIFGTLLTKGEADLEALAGVAEELYGLDVMPEVVTKLEKLSGKVSSSEEKQPLTTGLLEVTTIYTPGGTPQEIDGGDEHINLGWTCEGKIGPGEPDSGATANPETGGLYAYSRSWIGSDGSTALLGIEFDVPADNTDVNITTKMKYITATTSVGAGFAGTYIATRFADESVCYTTIDPPFGWEQAVKLICSVLGRFVPPARLVCALAECGMYTVDALDFVDLAQALSEMEGTEEKEITYSAGSLDRGRYCFYIGLHARTSAVVVGIAHAAAYGQVTQIKVTQDVSSSDLTITSTDGGQVTEPGEGTFTYWAGQEVNLVAEAEEGYYFVNWTGDVGTIGNVNGASTIIIMNDNRYVTANFEQIPPGQFSLTTSSTAGGSVTTPGEATFTYDAGTVVNLVATPASGYRFVNWTGDVGTIANVNAASTTITMNGDYSIMADFEAIPPVQYELTVSSTDGGSVTTPGEGTYTYNGGTVVNLVATAASGYRFVNWTGDVGTIANVNAASTTITVNSNYSVTANFEQILPGQFSLTISSTAGGSVTTPGQGTFTYDAGTVVNLVATRASGYQFVNWTGNVGTVANVNAASTTITMNSNYSITANFEEEEVVTFPDPNLEAAIRAAIGKPTGPIYISDAERIVYLYADQKNIADLIGLEYCTNLQDLRVHWNQISDISPLANLSNLATLDLDLNQISDISPLDSLTNLRCLLLFANQISDISPLANLTNLMSLTLTGNQISDISPLASLTNLTWLGLNINQISDITPLANLTNLTSLYLSDNLITDISPLVQNEGLGTGDHVNLDGNPLSSDSINIYIPQLQARGVTVQY